MGALTIYTTMNRYIFDVFLDGELFNRVETVANCYDAAEDIAVELYGNEIELVRIENNLQNLSFYDTQS